VDEGGCESKGGGNCEPGDEATVEDGEMNRSREFRGMEAEWVTSVC